MDSLDDLRHSDFETGLESVPWKIGMTSRNEQLYLQWFARNHFKGSGALVELGCWLGSLTQAICAGLKENPTLDIHAVDFHVYDNFVWENYMEETVAQLDLPFRDKLEIGDDFQHLFEYLNSDIIDCFTVHKSDLARDKWSGQPIEFLVLDAMKTEALCSNICRQFYPALIPGSSYILQQDFLHFYETWIHVACYRQREYIQPVYVVPDSGSLVLKFRECPPPNLLAFEPSMKDLSETEIDAAFEWNLDLVEDPVKCIIGAAHTMAYLHREEKSKARALFLKYAKLYPRESSFAPHYYQLEHLRTFAIDFGYIDDLPEV